MVACMGGSSLFGIAIASTSAAEMLVYVFLASSIALALPLVVSSVEGNLGAFLLFEACVGVYWPAMGTVRSLVVPEKTRATIYNIFRVPLNAIVLGVLLNHISTTTAFGCCAGMLFIAFLAQRRLVKTMNASGLPATGAGEQKNKLLDDKDSTDE